MKINFTFALSAALLLTSTSAQAAVLFDSKELSESAGQSLNDETRTSGFNYAAVLSFENDVSIDQLGVFTSVNNPQDIKFLIFESGLFGGAPNLLFSQTKFFAQNSTQQFIYSDAFNFTFQGGKTYDVGILGSAGQLTGRWSSGQTLTNGGISEISRNANFQNFASPNSGSYAGVTPFVQLLGNDVGAVPEPDTWAMMLLGFGFVGGAMRSAKRRQKLTVSYA